jgi:hypothetical protein
MSKKDYITIDIDNVPDIDVDDFEINETKIDQELQLSEYLNEIIAKKPLEEVHKTIEVIDDINTSEKTYPQKLEIIKTEIEEISEIEETTEVEENIKTYDPIVYNQAMDTITALMTGMKFNKSNWMILLNKITIIIRGVKQIKDNSIRTQLIYDLLMDYLDNYTELSDDIIDFINKNAKYTCEFMLENANVNKKQHKTNNKNIIKQYKLYSADTDAMINTLQITNLLVNKITVMIRSFKDFTSIQQRAPEIVMMCVKLVGKFKHLTTAERTSLIAQAIEEVLEKEVMPKFTNNSPEQVTMELFILNLPMLISTITGVVNGDIDFVEDIESAFKSIYKKVKKLLCCCHKKAKN